METFGRTADGEEIRRLTVSGGGLTANIINWGAVVQDLRLDGHRPALVLGFESFDDYPEKSPYFGAIAGRFANRIANGRFSIDGEEYQTDRNFLGKHTLHGGDILSVAEPHLCRGRLWRREAAWRARQDRQVDHRNHRALRYGQGVESLPRRRVVEHTFARPGRCRREAKDVEATIKSAVAWITIASIRLMISRLART